MSIDRFLAYAAAFEAAFATDDWTLLEPYFSDDATSELNGNRVVGRDAVIGSFRANVAMLDRRFDSRRHRIVVGPELDADGRVHIEAVARYELAGYVPLELRGEEWFTFAGDRIVRHVDRVLNGAEVMAYLAVHGSILPPIARHADSHGAVAG